MSVVNKWYRAAFAGQYSATAARRVDWVSDTIKTTLHTVTYTFAQDTDDFFNDATNELSTAGGYTAGGVTLGTKSIGVATTLQTQLIAANAQWTSATFTARQAVVWADTAGASSTDPLMMNINFGADQSVSSGTFTIAWAADGVGKVTVA
jgi:hypothetical protein